MTWTADEHAVSVEVRYTSIGRPIHEEPSLLFSCVCGWEQVAYGRCGLDDATAAHDRTAVIKWTQRG